MTKAIPPRWVRILIPLAIVAVWLGISSIGGPTFGTISDVTNNDQSSYLPHSAESTKVQDAQLTFFKSKSTPAVVIYTRGSGLTAADKQYIASVLPKLKDVKSVDSVSGPIPSTDGKAIEILAPVTTTKAGPSDAVASMRTVVKDGAPAGLIVNVTGPAGLGADFAAGFAGIDGILLVVALLAVFLILLIVYRSLLLPIVVLLTSVFALTGSILIVYLFAKAGWITVTGESRGILAILALGAATDYSMLLVSRFREALHSYRTSWEAIRAALRVSVEPIAASGTTVILGVLSLLLSGLNSNRGLGPVAAIAIAFSMLSALTALPALLVLFGRASFWPFRPKYVEGAPSDFSHAPISRLWKGVGRLISRRPRVIWVVSVIVLGICALGLLQLKANGVPQNDLLLTKSDSATGQTNLAKHFDAGSGSPVVIITPKDSADDVVALAKKTDGVAGVTVFAGANVRPGTDAPPVVVNDRVLIEATLKDQADSNAAQDVVVSLRNQLAKTEPSAEVGGVSAIDYDTNTTALADLRLIIPVVLGIILVILMLLLRAVVAPVILIATVVLSYGASLGISAVVFNHAFRFPGADPSVPLFGFVFLVALGVDYNIFLMTRVREESLRIGTRKGILQGLGATGGVITSAGIVLAATFSALAVVPILFLVQIAFLVALGVLIDTIIVRSLLVPSLTYDIGRPIWWPSKLARGLE